MATDRLRLAWISARERAKDLADDLADCETDLDQADAEIARLRAEVAGLRGQLSQLPFDSRRTAAGWRVRWRAENGKHRARSFRTRAEANAWIATQGGAGRRGDADA
ncbi:hypothetical protein [Streptomyces tremellae]|uniref:Uncharacterized protein n=1 Tax=Streptomyces tremellae TaxID=1124239 RepID=A0ABP7EFI4_9ACTN